MGSPATQTFTLAVDQAPAITSASRSDASRRRPSTRGDDHGHPDPALSESGALPAGVTFTDNGDGTATLGGTPGAGTAGSYPITITASNGVGSPTPPRPSPSRSTSRPTFTSADS